MRIATHAIIIATGVVGLIGSALAADMTGAELKAFLSGTTEYLETTGIGASTAPSQVVLYFDADGTALNKNVTTGVLLHGNWHIEGNTSCAVWKERPNVQPCVRYDKTGDTVTIIDAVSGQTRAKVVKVVAGNAEHLSP